MLFTDVSPEDVIVCEGTPVLRYLSCTAQGDGIKVSEDLEGDFAGEDGEWVNADKVCKLVGDEGELGETAHGKQALKNKGTSWMRGGAEGGPDGASCLTVFQR